MFLCLLLTALNVISAQKVHVEVYIMGKNTDQKVLLVSVGTKEINRRIIRNVNISFVQN